MVFREVHQTFYLILVKTPDEHGVYFNGNAPLNGLYTTKNLI